MSTAESRKLALDFIGFFAAGNMAAALDLLADDATWWVAGQPDQFSLAGTRGKAELPELFGWIGAALPQGVRSTVTGVTAEDERVAVEVDVHGTTRAGADYRNRLHFLFEVRDGRIIAVREYLDTLHVATTLLGGETDRGI